MKKPIYYLRLCKYQIQHWINWLFLPKGDHGSNCPYCGLDPYEYIDVGVGVPMPVAVNCCEYGHALIAQNVSPFRIWLWLKWEHVMHLRWKLTQKRNKGAK